MTPIYLDSKLYCTQRYVTFKNPPKSELTTIPTVDCENVIFNADSRVSVSKHHLKVKLGEHFEAM